MALHTEEDNILCKIFTIALCGFACTLFTNLCPHFITFFHNFSRKFMARFEIGIPTKRTSTHLFSIVKTPNKTLRDYITRFNKQALQIQEI